MAKPKPQTPLGDLLVEAGLLKQAQLGEALRYQKEIGGHLGQILVKLGFVEEDALLRHLSKQLQVQLFDVEDFVPDAETMKLLPRELLERLNAVPLRRNAGGLVVGISDPTDFAGLDELRMHARMTVETLLISPSKARDVLNRFYHGVRRDAGGASASGRLQRRGRAHLSELVHNLEVQMRSRPHEALARFSPEQRVAGLISALVEKGVLSAHEIEEACTRITQAPPRKAR